MGIANPLRGEAIVAGVRLRPTFAALVAAEREVGPLFALIERAAAGGLSLGETVSVLWACAVDAPDGMTREGFGEAVVAGGLAEASGAVRAVLAQVLAGR